MKTLHFAVLFAPIFALAACSDDDPATSPPANTPQADAGATTPAAKGPGDFKADYKTSPDFFTNMAAAVAGSSPHKTAQVWYSTNVKDLIAGASFTAPEGTTSIKDFDTDGDGKIDGIAVMIKKEAGYDAANGDWYYDMRDPSGAIMPDPPAGKIAMCIGCHGSSKSTDYLAGTKLR